MWKKVLRRSPKDLALKILTPYGSTTSELPCLTALGLAKVLIDSKPLRMTSLSCYLGEELPVLVAVRLPSRVRAVITRVHIVNLYAMRSWGSV